ncbi:MAG: type II secretion system protein [Nitrospirota bacterium]
MIMLKNMLNKKGFTLIELLIVITILGVLLMIVIAKVPQVLTRAKEAKTRDYLANMRVAINNYYSTTSGFFPMNFDNLSDVIGGQEVPAFTPNFMQEIPKASIRANLEDGAASNSNNVRVIDTGKNLMIPDSITKEGGWIYSSTTGEIRVNCSVKDSKEKIYYSTYGHEANE